MKTIDSYIARMFVLAFLVAHGGLVFLYYAQACLTGLLDKDQSALQTIIYQGLHIPMIAVQLAPPSTLIATVMTLSGLNRTAELTACYSLGIGIQRIVSVILGLVAVLAIVLFVAQDRILPPVHKVKTLYYWQKIKQRADFVLDIQQDKIWYRSKNLIYNLRAFDPKENRIVGMTVYGFDDKFRLAQLVQAESARYTNNGWKLQKGVITEIPTTDPFPVVRPFEEMKLAIQEKPRDFQELDKEVDGLKTAPLFKYIKQLKYAALDTKSYEVALHSRFSLSLMPFVMCLLGVPFAIGNRREGGAARDLVACMGVTFLYWILFSISLSMGQAGTVNPVFAAWAPSVIFLVLAIYALNAKAQR